MPLWGKAKLTPSKAVELGKGEIVFAVGNAGRFCEGENFDTPLQGHVTLTTHRVVIVAGDRATTGCVHLSRVVTVELKWVLRFSSSVGRTLGRSLVGLRSLTQALSDAPYNQTPRLLLHQTVPLSHPHRGQWMRARHGFGVLLLEQVADERGRVQGAVSCASLGRSGGIYLHTLTPTHVDATHASIESSLSKQVWEQQAREEAAERRKNDVSAAAETDGAGLIGLKSIIRRREKAQRRNEALAADAFSDLDSLMDKARDLVKLITRYSEAREKEKEGKAKGAGTMSVASSRAGASGGGDEEWVSWSFSVLSLPSFAPCFPSDSFPPLPWTPVTPHTLTPTSRFTGKGSDSTLFSSGWESRIL